MANHSGRLIGIVELSTPIRRRRSPVIRWGLTTASILLLAVAAMTFVPGLPEVWQTRKSVDLQSGDEKVEELIFGLVVHSRDYEGSFSRQLRQYVHPAATTPRWCAYSWHDHFHHGWGDGIFIGRRCDEAADWMELKELDPATRAVILKRLANELAALDEDAVVREVNAVEQSPPPR
jgi:hypothetical protein